MTRGVEPSPDNMSSTKLALAAVQSMRAKLEAMQKAQREPIAIVGIGCRFPGGVTDCDTYWNLLRNGVDAIKEVPRNRWDIDAFYDPNVEAPGRMITRYAGFVDSLEEFEPEFFGISPREAVSMDPQQRMLLEVAWEALENAAIAPNKLSGSATGVFIGICNNDFGSILFRRGVEKIDAHLATGIAHSVAAGRLSYFWGLQGPCVSVDTACSSSLVAVHLACQSLRQRECELAIAGGVNRILSPELSINFSKNRMLSPGGRCKTFDAGADGFTRGEGAGIVVLRRLSSALEAGDPIIALIRGTAINQDGRTSGLTVPNGPSQQTVIRRALENGGVAAKEVDLVEAHGTGTSLGDPIEMGALAATYCEGRPLASPLVVGSVKTNIGHLEAAAGIAGLIKAALSLKHREIPPHLNFETPSPHIPWQEIPVSVPRELTAWKRGEHPRRAGVSSFGFSGTNAHAVLEEAPLRGGNVSPARRSSHVLHLSARTDASLGGLCRLLAEYLERNKETEIAEVCHTLNKGRASFDLRAIFTVSSREDAIGKLRRFLAGELGVGIIKSELELLPRPRVAFVFGRYPGGAENFASQLYASLPPFRDAIDHCDEAAKSFLKVSLAAIFAGTANTATKDDSIVGSVAFFARQIAYYSVWKAAGVEPASLIGNGAGEFAAAWASGAMPLDDAIRLAAIFGALDEAREKSPGRLPEVVNEFERAVNSGKYSEPVLEWTSGATGGPIDKRGVDAGWWMNWLNAKDNFETGVAHLASNRFNVFLEIGTGGALTGRVLENLQRLGALAATAGGGVDEWNSLILTAGSLLGRGIDLNWHALDGAFGFQRINGLPTYPFHRRRYWPDDPVSRPADHPLARTLEHPLVGHMIRSPLLDAVVFESSFSESSLPLLKDHLLFGETVVPGACQLCYLLGCARQLFKDQALEFSDVLFHRALSIPKEKSRLVQVVMDGVNDGGAKFKLLSLEEGDVDGVVHSSGKVAAGQIGRTQQTAWGDQSIPALWEQFTNVISSAELYSAKRLGPIHLGAAYRWIDSIRTSGNEVVGKFRIPSAAGNTERFILHPGLIDACVGLMVMTFDAGEGKVLIPFGMESFRFYRSPRGKTLWGHARYRESTGDSSRLFGDIRLTDEDGALLAEIIGIEGRKADRDVLVRGIQRDISGWFYEPKWIAQTAPTTPSRRFDGESWLILCDKSGVGEKLARQIEAGGGRPVCVFVGASFVSHGADRFQSNPLVRDDFVRILDEATDAARPFRVVIHLWGLGDAPQNQAELKRGLAQGCGGLLHLTQALIQRKEMERPRLAIVTSGAQSVDGPLQSPVGAALWGLATSLSVEHPDLRCSRFDLEAKNEASDFAALAQMIRAGGREDRIAWRNGKRLVLRFGGRHVRVDGRLQKLNPDGSYLICGGLGALGLHVARWLIGRGARHLVLSGRSAPSASVQAALAGLQTDGVTISVVKADLAELGEVSELINQIAVRHPLRGVFHTAGVIDDGLLQQQTWDSFERVLAAKTVGLMNLHQATREIPLDFFVGFSSLVSLVGVPGQGNYAAANAFMDAFMAWRQGQGLPGLSINWGPWAEGGMAATLTDRDRERHAKLGLNSLDTGDALRALGAALGESISQIGVMEIDWKRYVRQFSQVTESAYLDELIEDQDSSTTGRSWTELLTGTPLDKRRDVLAGLLRERLAAVLGMAAEGKIGLREPVFNLGVDSIMAVELQAQIEAGIGQPLSSTLIFDFPTIEALTEHLLAKTKLDQSSNADQTVSPTGTTGDQPGEFDNLSSDELADLLARRLEALNEADAK